MTHAAGLLLPHQREKAGDEGIGAVIAPVPSIALTPGPSPADAGEGRLVLVIHGEGVGSAMRVLTFL
jgi:hypothetical protein